MSCTPPPLSNATTAGGDKVVRRLPVYLTKALGDHLRLIQYPVRTRPYDRNSLPTGARYKPQSGLMEMTIPLNTDEAVYDQTRGSELSLGTTDRQVQTVLDGPENSTSPDKEELLMELKLRGESIPLRTNYMLGVVRDDALHLTPIRTIHQMRPSFDYLDRIDEKHKAAARRVAEKDAQDGRTGAGREREGKNRSIQVQVKSTSETEAAAAAREASQTHWARLQDEEPWSRLTYYDVETEASGQVFEALMAQHHEPMTCDMSKDEVMSALTKVEDE